MRGSSARIDNILDQLDAEIAGSSRYVPPLKTHDGYGASHRPSDDAFDLSGGMSLWALYPPIIHYGDSSQVIRWY